MDDLIGKLSEIRSEYNCFDEDEEPYYRALSEAIEIISRCVDGDTISRQAAIDALAEWHDDAITNRLNNLPSAQRWIPVTEGLPDEYEYVLLTCAHNGKIAVDFGCISPDIDGHPSWWIAAHDLIEGWRVLAWCLLPEPWKGKEHERID